MRRIRIGIITIHATDNYGAVIQAFAFKTVCEKYGDAFILDYRSEYLAKNLSYISFPSSFRRLLRFFKDLLRIRSRRITLKRFEEFINDELNLQNFQKTDFDESRFDIYVSGSDQIWNPKCVSACNKIDGTYFFDFVVNKPKASYASSIGSYQYSKDEERIVTKLLSDYKAISVREKNTSTYLSELLSRNVKCLLDPTLLLSLEEYQEIIHSGFTPSRQRDYILVYSIQYTNTLKRMIENAKNCYPNFEIVVLEQNPWDFFEGDETIRTAGPREFLKLFSDAKAILTDSFHGVCFSLVFKKPFLSALPKHHPNRIVSLLSLVGESDRLVSDEESNYGGMLESIPRTDNLKKLREISFQYLKVLFETTV